MEAYERSPPRSRTIAMKASGVIMVMPSYRCKRQQVFVSGHDVGGLGTMSRGNHHVIIGITDHHGHLG